MMAQCISLELLKCCPRYGEIAIPDNHHIKFKLNHCNGVHLYVLHVLQMNHTKVN